VFDNLYPELEENAEFDREWAEAEEAAARSDWEAAQSDREAEEAAADTIDIPALLEAARQTATMHNMTAINHTGKLPCQYSLQITVDLLTAIRTARMYKPNRIFYTDDSLYISWGDDTDYIYASYVCLSPDVH
jgi:hypothetical protein